MSKLDMKKCIITVDDREPAFMGMMLDSYGAKWERKRMVTGDYVCGDVCIERKTVDDMCGSIVDGRLKRQVERMKKEFKYVYVLVSGKLKDRKSEVHENCILGKMVSLLVKDGVPVLCVDDDIQMAYVIKRICERHCDGN